MAVHPDLRAVGRDGSEHVHLHRLGQRVVSLMSPAYQATAPPPTSAPTVWSTPARTESGLARLREATPRELEDWDALVAGFWNHRITHRRSWIESLPGWQTVSLGP